MQTILEKRAPALSVVIATLDRYESIRRTTRHLAAQTVVDRIELLIVAPSQRGFELVEDDLRGFHSYRLVEVGEIRSLPAARAVGIREATAPLVALAEDHCFPDPGWAEAISRAHERPCAGVAPAITNANPRSVTSWIFLFMDYGRWVEPREAALIEDIPGHNSSYDRRLLLEYGPRLDSMLETASVMHRDLRAKGHRLWIEPAAVMRHVNMTRPVIGSIAQYYLGRRFAAGRGQGWSGPRRLFYAAAVPALLLIYLRQHIREIRRAGRLRQLMPWGLPVLLLALAVRGLGEVVGFSLGAGDVSEQSSDLEVRRERFISRRDLLDLANP